MVIFTCIFLSFICLSSSECIEESPNYYSKEVNLHDDLIKKYESTWQAAKMAMKVVTVNVTLHVKTFQFINEEEEFLVNSWIYLTWKDKRLTWDPADYDNINTTMVDIKKIWFPRISLNSELAYLYGLYSPLHKCQVLNSGIVTCVPKVTHVVKCSSILTNWPHDTQTCKIEYIAKNKNVILSYANSKPISTVEAMSSTGWTIAAYSFTRPDELKSNLVISLTVERTAALFSDIYVSPLIVIAALDLGALFLDIKSILRVYMVCFCLACDYVFVQTINDNIPLGGVGTPKVLMFLRNSILMSAVSLVTTYTLRNVRKRTKPTPVWLIQFNDIILKDSRTKFIWPKWEPEFNEDESVKKTLEDWNSFSFVLNFFLLFTYFLAYFISFLIYIPKPIRVTF